MGSLGLITAKTGGGSTSQPASKPVSCLAISEGGTSTTYQLSW